MKFIKYLAFTSIATMTICLTNQNPANADINHDIAKIACTFEAKKTGDAAMVIRNLGDHVFAAQTLDFATNTLELCNSPYISTPLLHKTIKELKTINAQLLQLVEESSPKTQNTNSN